MRTVVTSMTSAKIEYPDLKELRGMKPPDISTQLKMDKVRTTPFFK